MRDDGVDALDAPDRRARSRCAPATWSSPPACGRGAEPATSSCGRAAARTCSSRPGGSATRARRSTCPCRASAGAGCSRCRAPTGWSRSGSPTSPPTGRSPTSRRRAREEEAQLLAHASAALEVSLGPEDVAGRYAGLRPLLAGDGAHDRGPLAPPRRRRGRRDGRTDRRRRQAHDLPRDGAGRRRPHHRAPVPHRSGCRSSARRARPPAAPPRLARRFGAEARRGRRAAAPASRSRPACRSARPSCAGPSSTSSRSRRRTSPTGAPARGWCPSGARPCWPRRLPRSPDRAPPLTAADVDDVARADLRPGDAPLHARPRAAPEGFARSWYERYERRRADGDGEAFAIAGDDGAFLGLALAPTIDEEAAEAELGYIVAAHARGRGVASGALELLTRWAFDERGIQRAYLIIDVDNPRPARSPSGPVTGSRACCAARTSSRAAAATRAVVAAAGRSARHHSSIAGSPEAAGRGTAGGRSRCRGRRSRACAGRARSGAGPPRPGAAACIANRLARSSQASSPVRAKSSSSAKPLPAVPWQRLAPLRSGPAAHVSSPPSSSSASSSPSRGSAAIDVTTPGAPWHHCVRIVPLRWTSGSPIAGGQFARPLAADRGGRQRRRGAAGEQPVVRQQLRAAGERGDDARQPVRRRRRAPARCRRAAGSRSAARARPSGPAGPRRSRSTPPPSGPRRCARASRRRSAAGPGCPTSARACRPRARRRPARRAGPRAPGAGASSQATSAIPPSPDPQARAPGRRTRAAAGSSPARRRPAARSRGAARAAPPARAGRAPTAPRPPRGRCRGARRASRRRRRAGAAATTPRRAAPRRRRARWRGSPPRPPPGSTPRSRSGSWARGSNSITADATVTRRTNTRSL